MRRSWRPPICYTPEETQKNILAALAPLGPDYALRSTRAFNERWIDLYPNEGKRSGAYSNGGAYDVHPYMLINYNGKYEDMSTVAHELGHTMHSYLSNKTQPFPPGRLSDLRCRSRLDVQRGAADRSHAQDDQGPRRRGCRCSAAISKDIKGTVFRQTQFAEFELRIHEMAEKGEPLTGEALDKLYLDITRKYYGHDKGVCIVDDYVAHEWAFIPHFYRNFYVFQYATSFTASAALSEKVLAGDPAATKRYLAFLSRRRLEVSDRSAEGRRRRHDDRRAAAAHAAEDESRDGRDGAS